MWTKTISGLPVSFRKRKVSIIKHYSVIYKYSLYHISSLYSLDIISGRDDRDSVTIRSSPRSLDVTDNKICVGIPKVSLVYNIMIYYHYNSLKKDISLISINQALKRGSFL